MEGRMTICTGHEAGLRGVGMGLRRQDQLPYVEADQPLQDATHRARELGNFGCCALEDMTSDAWRYRYRWL